MTSGTNSGQLYQLALLITIGLIGSASASGFELADLLQQIAHPNRDVSFEYRQIERQRLLTEPTVTPGRIAIARDGTIHQSWDGEDGVYELTVRGHEAKLTTPERERQFRLANRPRLQALVTALRAVASADTATLRDHFEVAVTGNASNWQLELVLDRQGTQVGKQPQRDSRLILTGGNRLERIRLKGEGLDTEIIIDGPPS